MKPVHEIIVNQIIEKLEAGIIPWKKTWVWWVPMNYATWKEYRWINRLLLSMDDYESNYYLTYKQIKDLWWVLQKWSKATKIVYWNVIESSSDKSSDASRKSTTSTSTETQEQQPTRYIAKYYNVFNLSQTNLVPDDMVTEQIETDSDNTTCKTILGRYRDKPQIIYWPQPCYYGESDIIKIPNKESFTSSDTYYSTLFHELIHSTGNKKRLAREGVTTKNHFWSEEYSKEELIAEIWSLFLSSYCNISNSTMKNSVDYIGWWLKYIKQNKWEVISAASKAEKAVEYILKNGLSY